MTFNIVIANPPYDRKDTQMKFASLAHDLCTQYSMIIMPAKWQCKGDKTKEKLYSTFRAKVVPHMSDICFFPESSDIFSVMATDGITYYLAVKNKTYNIKHIKNKCVYSTFFNNEREREFTNKSSLNNLGQEIINKLKDYKPFLVSEHTDDKEYQAWVGALISTDSIIDSDGKWINSVISEKALSYILGICELNTLEEVQQGLQHDNYNPLFTSDSLLEVISFLSYAYTKFVRFLIFNSICGLRSTGQDTWWRFVPDQTFDHIFTDAELYEKYNLSEEDIAVIEGTIAERPLKTVLSWLPQQYITQALEELNNKI